jgi:heat shock protein HslJ
MKQGQQIFRFTLYLIAFALLASCTATGNDHDNPAPPPPTSQTAPAAEPAADAARGASTGFAFGGTQWQLVEIQSMDDTSFKPQDRSHYTINFTPDGRALIRADCNRAAATWTVKGASELEFGPMASTRMKCSADSLWERYIAQFEWVRSYVTRDGHLFLATMADGAIIEFEPLPEP